MAGMKPNVADRLVVLALVVSAIATYPAAFATSLLLKDISEAFGMALGVGGLIQTAFSVVSLVFALVLSGLSMRFTAKALLMAGLGAVVLSSVGCGFAQNAVMVLAFYALTGIGNGVIPPMGITLVSQRFAEKDRSRVIGWFVAGMTFSGIVGLPLVGFIAEHFGWRMAYLGYALPLAVLGLILSAVGIPSSPVGGSHEDKARGMLHGYRVILGNSSALACLVTTVLVMTAWQAADLYSAAFYRDRFFLGLGLASLLLTTTMLFFTVASTLSARFILRFGKKPLAVAAVLLAGLMVALFTSVPELYLSAVSRILASVFVALFYNAKVNVLMDLVPGLRGATMSLDQASGALGAAVGAALGGVVFTAFGYWAIGPIHGFLMVVSALVFRAFVAVQAQNVGN